jgi:hypothetical protein
MLFKNIHRKFGACKLKDMVVIEEICFYEKLAILGKGEGEVYEI